MIFPPPNGSDSNGNSAQDDYSDISEPRRRQALQRARNWFIALVSAGLGLGLVVALGLVQLLNSWGLTNKPDRPFITPNESTRNR